MAFMHLNVFHLVRFLFLLREPRVNSTVCFFFLLTCIHVLKDFKILIHNRVSFTVET